MIKESIYKPLFDEGKYEEYFENIAADFIWSERWDGTGFSFGHELMRVTNEELPEIEDEEQRHKLKFFYLNALLRNSIERQETENEFAEEDEEEVWGYGAD